MLDPSGPRPIKQESFINFSNHWNVPVHFTTFQIQCTVFNYTVTRYAWRLIYWKYLKNAEMNTSILTSCYQYYCCTIIVTEHVTDLITVHAGAKNRMGIQSKLIGSWQCGYNLALVIFIFVSKIDVWSFFCETNLRFLPSDGTDHGAIGQQGITWTNVDQVLWRHNASLDQNELMQYTQRDCTLFELGCVLLSFVATTWWRNQMETFPALLALCDGNPLATGGFPSQRSVTLTYWYFLFDLRLKNGWRNNRCTRDLRCHHAHLNVIVMMYQPILTNILQGDISGDEAIMRSRSVCSIHDRNASVNGKIITKY